MLGPLGVPFLGFGVPENPNIKQEGRGPAILHKLFKKLDLSRGVVVVGEW